MTANASKLLLIFAKKNNQILPLNCPGLPITDSCPIIATGKKNFVTDPLLLLHISSSIKSKPAKYGGYFFHLSFQDEDKQFYYVILQKGDSDVAETKSASDPITNESGWADDDHLAGGWDVLHHPDIQAIDQTEWCSTHPDPAVDSHDGDSVRHDTHEDAAVTCTCGHMGGWDCHCHSFDGPVKHDAHEDTAAKLAGDHGNSWGCGCDENSWGCSCIEYDWMCQCHDATQRRDSSRVAHTHEMKDHDEGDDRLPHAHPASYVRSKRAHRRRKHNVNKDVTSWYTEPSTQVAESGCSPSTKRFLRSRFGSTKKVASTRGDGRENGNWTAVGDSSVGGWSVDYDYSDTKSPPSSAGPRAPSPATVVSSRATEADRNLSEYDDTASGDNLNRAANNFTSAW
ncbi:hypothetical protein P170DRAFT_430903 [Aspergillus steynii IBT 23096]|uniref:Uncharacterized protein n=1 Tax=Aspergillus steynii IBT 23096 TaxID=1392250 RepID=A0A2I2FTJ4_9EURO|nr:uncharacterized protein P170DRAFT_430903 [Aspergillus steynii IBT 23096]PLB43897.1 hypothetical protein P170DRAFT_430903 [Aspergillus steynii IBT 23096]